MRIFLRPWAILPLFTIPLGCLPPAGAADLTETYNRDYKTLTALRERVKPLLANDPAQAAAAYAEFFKAPASVPARERRAFTRRRRPLSPPANAGPSPVGAGLCARPPTRTRLHP